MAKGNDIQFDLLDQLLILVLGVLLLAGNLGWIDPVFMGYWPLFPIIWVLKTIILQR